MNKENTEKLIAIYPELFSDLHELSCMHLFGFECGDGWFDLLAECIENIKKVCEKNNLHIQAHQVKEKYGSLRFYLSQVTDELDKIIDFAEKKSCVTCEVCGKLGKIRKLSWIQVLCEECLQKIEAKV